MARYYNDFCDKEWSLQKFPVLKCLGLEGELTGREINPLAKVESTGELSIEI